ncbi:MAG: phosphoglucomutase (alpha-D-glucose-1,6-bisphosphate-dependent) [Rhodothermia bacterium]|nr:MAG: phosphoglucomutase (alpha-D-glucose-1,6-bisphosphate-dependent) [Rhodothermia bacterium]
MPIHELAGQPVPVESLIDISLLEKAYAETRWEKDNPAAIVSFGTSGHRGTSLNGSFTEAQILAIAQAVCEFRTGAGICGPLYLGKDTHALSKVAYFSVLEVLVANDVDIICQNGHGFTPTPVISHAILTHNRNRESGVADGLIITPSHNPPQDGGIKYNPPHGGPGEASVTAQIEARANELLNAGSTDVCRIELDSALRSSRVMEVDFVGPYVDDLENVLDMSAISDSGIRIGADPLGGAGVAYWGRIAGRYGLDLTVVNDAVDPTFSFMRVDKDGKTRMDCSSPYAMAGLIELRDSFDIAFGNDPDFDRHGIVSGKHGLLSPNHYLAVAINYLFRHRPAWPPSAQVGKTLVSSSIIDRVAADLSKGLTEVPVGFKWFVEGLLAGTIGFGGEESAGASFLRKDGTAWTTDKDGIIMNLLAAEIMSVTDRDPGDLYQTLTDRFGKPVYDRSESPATEDQKNLLKTMSAEDVPENELAGDPILAKLTRAPGNGEAIGGLKVVTEFGWFAARPSGTEDIYKIYAESFRGEDHLARIQVEARSLIDGVFAGLDR